MIKQYDSDELKRLQKVEIDICKDIHEVCKKYDIGYTIAFGSLIGAIRHKGFIPWDDDMDIAMFREDYERFEKIFDKELSDKYYLMSSLRDKGYYGNVVKVEKKGTTFINRHSNKMKCAQGIFVDIFIYDKVPQDAALFKKQCRKSRFLAMLIFLYCSPFPEIPIKGIIGAVAKAVCFVAHYILHIVPKGNVFFYKKLEKICKLSDKTESDEYIIYQDPYASGTLVNRSDIEPYKTISFDGEQLCIPNNYDKVLKNYYGDYMQLPPEDKRVNHAADILDFGE